MRTAFLFPLSLSLVVAAGCTNKAKEPAARSDLDRDLTLVGQAPQTAVATPLELRQIRTTDSRSTVSSRHKVRHRPARSTASAPKLVPVAVHVAPAPSPTSVQPTTTADPHELPPGKTVAIIPVSSGPSTSDPRGDDRFPEYRGTGGSGMGGGERAGGGSGMGGDCPRPDFAPTLGVGAGTRGLMY